jgi:exopolysaccharide biosynthesis predicted pyruvyltransferase EpsI
MIDIKNFLAKYQSEKIKYIPNQGNAGDSLIGFATLQVLDELELDYEICKPTEVFEGQIILYGGGGSLIRKYQGSKKFLLNNHKKNDIIVLPHSFHDCDDLLTNLSRRVVLIAREKISYDYVKSKSNYPSNCLLSHDMAFHTQGIGKYKSISCVGTCNSFRFDDELSGDNRHVKVPEDNKDISIDFQRPMFMKNWNLSDHINTQVKKNLSIATDNIFSYLSKFTEVNTNRLHVGIAAALLGKTVNLYRGSYHKIAGVYDFSMRDKFNNVTYHGH